MRARPPKRNSAVSTAFRRMVVKDYARTRNQRVRRALTVENMIGARPEGIMFVGGQEAMRATTRRKRPTSTGASSAACCSARSLSNTRLPDSTNWNEAMNLLSGLSTTCSAQLYPGTSPKTNGTRWIRPGWCAIDSCTRRSPASTRGLVQGNAVTGRSAAIHRERGAHGASSHASPLSRVSLGGLHRDVSLEPYPTIRFTCTGANPRPVRLRMPRRSSSLCRRVKSHIAAPGRRANIWLWPDPLRTRGCSVPLLMRLLTPSPFASPAGVPR